MLRFAAAAEIVESDLWTQYNELGGVPDAEVPGGTGNPTYTSKLKNFDDDFPIYELVDPLSQQREQSRPRSRRQLSSSRSGPECRKVHGNSEDRQRPEPGRAHSGIASTAAFHISTIEQGGTSLYPSMAQRATSVEVLRIMISIGPTETMHFQTWSEFFDMMSQLAAEADAATRKG